MLRENTMMLPVKLTDREIQARGQLLAGDWGDIDAEEAAIKAQFKTKMEKLKERREALREHRDVVRTGEERRVVRVYREADIEGSSWRVYREDTGEYVTSEEMTQGEYRDQVQPNLFDGARGWKGASVEGPANTDGVVGLSPEEVAAHALQEDRNRLIAAANKANDEGADPEAIDAVFLDLGGLPFEAESIPADKIQAAIDRLNELAAPVAVPVEVPVKKAKGKKSAA